jgi:DNA-binding NarL/FixJ family response regulator
MKIGVIGIRSSILKNLSLQSNWKITFYSISDSIQSIAENKEVFNNDMLIINSELKGLKNDRIDLQGVDLIYWLRFQTKNPFKGPILVTGFLTIFQAVRLNSKCTIVLAPEHDYMQLPMDKKKLIQLLEKVKLKKEKSIDIDLLRGFLKYKIDLTEIRHKEANWWGVKNLWDTLNSVHDKNLEYPAKIKQELKHLNNYLTSYYYKIEEDKFDQAAMTNMDRLKDQCLKELAKVKKRKDLKVLLIDDQAEQGWSEAYRRILFEDGDYSKCKSLNIRDLKQVILIIDSAISDIIEFDPHFIILDLRLLPHIDDKIALNVSKISGIKVLMALKEKYPGLPILISSASNKIWSYQEVISSGADAYWIKEGIDNLINHEKSLMNYLQLLRFANAFMNEEYQFLKEMYIKYIELFSNDSKYWWESGSWPKPKKDKFRYTPYKLKSLNNSEIEELLPVKRINKKEDIAEIILQSIELYSTFLRKLYILKTISKSNSWFYYSSMILHFSKLIEKIHDYNSVQFHKIGGISLISRLRQEDKIALEISSQRNKVAHFKESTKTNFSDFENQYNKICIYLKHGKDVN